MCKINVVVNAENADFVLFNHLYSREGGSFSIRELRNELRALYGLEIDNATLQNEIDDYLDSGLVEHSFDKYRRCMS